MPSKTFHQGKNVGRTVKLSHPGKDVTFAALAMPRNLPEQAPARKRIRNIANWIIQPEIRVDGVVRTKFRKAVTITADFSSKDSEKAHRRRGKPILYLFCTWKEGKSWKWKRLRTTVKCTDKNHTRGTLTAKTRDLHPADPMGDGFD